MEAFLLFMLFLHHIMLMTVEYDAAGMELLLTSE